MRSHVEFRSSEFTAYESEEHEINPGRYGKRLAEFLMANLPRYGFKVRSLGAADWGWMVDLENEKYPLWIGCGNYEEYDDGFLCFIEPSKPVVRKWFKKMDATATVEKLAVALESILQESGKASNLRWWSEDEINA